MSDDGPDEEAVVVDFCAVLDFCRSEVNVKPVVARRNGHQVEVSHPVKLKLEGERRFQMPVYSVFLELKKLNLVGSSKLEKKHYNLRD